MKKPLQSQSATTTHSDGEEELGDDDDMDCLNIDTALKKLRAPPPLTWQDFRRKFLLSHEGCNAHQLNGNDVPEDEVVKLFGKAQGMKGRSGYRVFDCKDPEVQERVTFLYPVCYQHDVSAMLPMVGRKFARGITYEKMGHEVDWARFAAETNQRQCKHYEREKVKLDMLKDLVDKSSQAPKSKNWRKFKPVKV
jgi:hypothetical protein